MRNNEVDEGLGTPEDPATHYWQYTGMFYPLWLVSAKSSIYLTFQSPWGAAFVARGLQTLPLRVDKICSNALAVAQFLEKHPKVRHVSYAGLESHPGHKAALKYMKKFGGMMAFDVGSAEAAYKVVETVRLIVHAVSLGGTESLMEHPASMTHGKELVRNEKEPIVNPGLIRLSVGIENVEDIINDLNRALALI
ncbi:Cys/Met metabolism PLP-dependent enzyme [Oesophagostomum dentatum]|uniref:Cys/Met metabolism PLP-dependent enzyme n=1 Tax=Oesophagostomum dentatum TaxID=61180 RepID=A0A0B1TNE6_OESDE|nr:Cys/Met metabolism PLP-dependent enzyme [Oesophagostomum dentatum]